MAQRPLRVGIIGAGGNTRLRHIPGLRAQPDVEIVAVCNRRPESTRAAATEFGIPRVFDRWEDVVGAADVDAIVIGTWPYLHCPITVAALESGKHVLTEARMSRNAVEAHQMLAAAERHPHLVCQVVPSPFGLKGHTVVRELIDGGFLGRLLEVHVRAFTNALGGEEVPLSWRQDVNLSGFNMLTLGILHETLMRWAPRPVRVMAQAHAFVPERIDPESGARRPVGTPDSVQVLAVLEGGARAVYHFSGVAPFGQGQWIELYGSEGMLHYDLGTDQIYGMSRQRGKRAGRRDEWEEIPIPAEKAGGWRVEQEFVEAIRGGPPVRFTDFATGVAYMEFTEAVARSAEKGEALDLPLL